MCNVLTNRNGNYFIATLIHQIQGRIGKKEGEKEGRGGRRKGREVLEERKEERGGWSWVC